jgi:predicted dehydrogenase
MKHSRKVSRRQFVAAAAAPWIVPASVFGRQDKPAPSGRITMGFVGLGGMGMANLNGFLGHKDVQVVAVCDVDKGRVYGKDGFGQGAAKGRVEQHYAAEMKSGTYKGCEAYTDFREVCARKDIDAVVVCTVDHWHALCAVEALKNGKDVYCEKPITHHLREGRIVCDAVRKHNRIFQTGSQQRSEWRFRRGVEIVRNGLIGKVKHVEVGLPTGHNKIQGDGRPQDPPASLDYDFWCGPSRKLPFIPARFHFHWRWCLDYGGGQLTDWIGHHNDIGHWGLDVERSGPVEIEAAGFDYMADKSVYDAPINYEVKCTYAGGVTSSISNKHPMGTKWIGEKGWVSVDRDVKRCDGTDKEWFKKEFNPGPVKVYESNSHHRNFIDGIKTRKECIAAAEIAHRSASCAHLGYLSQALGRKIKWDPEKEMAIDDETANKTLELRYRSPWKLEA